MIKVEKIEVWGFEHAIRGMRNPKNSWDRSDSYFEDTIDVNSKAYSIGENDLNLMRTLYNAGSEHRKYLRQIFVSMDITAPLYWWKEFDTYKVGTTADSCSTMHKIHAKEFELDDFSHEHLFTEEAYDALETIIDKLNSDRNAYIKTKQKEWWYQMIQLLPSSYNQKRTVTFTYENVVSMIRQRSGHKLDEWRNFVEILKDLPYVREIIDEADNIRRIETDSKVES